MSKKFENKLPTRRFVPVKFKNETLCSKGYYISKSDSRGKWTPNYEGSCAITSPTMDDELALPMNAGAVKKYFIKK
ncbi:hypothetical protein MTR_6g065240 [Medicago truncatula]|uniref:Uncharacterized protein n=1 Tax=Medicago truncatula TaxID=3880 RepID=G7KNW3_MEDTR|nr:hypothetical protein MTR_6g065240 [Medicago truncatula]